jgi:hypothetical protein
MTAGRSSALAPYDSADIAELIGRVMTTALRTE